MGELMKLETISLGEVGEQRGGLRRWQFALRGVLTGVPLCPGRASRLGGSPGLFPLAARCKAAWDPRSPLGA